MIREPTRATLRKYGLTLVDWWLIALTQGNACAICKRAPSTGRLCIDHEHGKGWSRLKPEQRKARVRGLLCWTCNRLYVGRGITLERARNAVIYLEAYEERK